MANRLDAPRTPPKIEMQSLSPFLGEKIACYFHLLDADHDGRIEASDIARVTSRLIDLCGVEDFSPRAKSLKAAQDEFWATLEGAADEEGSGYVTLDDLKGFFRTMRADLEKWDGQVRGYARGHVLALFEAIDHDHSGDIDAEEYALYLESLGIEESGAEVFVALDHDGDGKISFDELAELYVTWVRSDDPAEVGNRLLCGGA